MENSAIAASPMLDDESDLDLLKDLKEQADCINSDKWNPDFNHAVYLAGLVQKIFARGIVKIQ